MLASLIVCEYFVAVKDVFDFKMGAKQGFLYRKKMAVSTMFSAFKFLMLF